MKIKVQKKINQLKKYTKRQWNIDIDISIKYSLSSARILGTCEYIQGSCILNLNENLLNEYKDIYINEVVVHEFAHAVIFNLYKGGYNGYKKIMPHGKEFKAVCSHFGIVGRATTNLFKNSTTRLKSSNRQYYTYNCGCNDNHEISSTIHNRISRGAIYTCKRCKKPLMFKSKI